MFFDTHAHINLHAFKDDAEEVMQRAFTVGVGVMNVGTELATSKQAVSMLKDYPLNVYAIVGLHPSHTYDNPYLDENESAFTVEREEFDYEAYKELAQNPRVVGIGECGLDYYRLPLEGKPQQAVFPSNGAEAPASFSGSSSDAEVNSDILGVSVISIVVPPRREAVDLSAEASAKVEGSLRSVSVSVGMAVDEIKRLQREAFLGQVKLALELDKALAIHCRPSKGSSDAYDDVLEILLRAKDQGLGMPRFEVHSFTGSLEVAKKFLELGGYIGLNGIITFDKTGNMAEVVKGVSLERIVLETDAPYLAPVPHRGKRNEPAYVVEVAKKIAELKDVSLEEVEKQTFENTKKLFQI